MTASESFGMYYVNVTSPYNEHPLQIHFIQGKMWFAGEHIIFLIFALNIDC